jgi:tight adherence protein B
VGAVILLIALGGMLLLTGLALGIALALGVQMPTPEPAPADRRPSWLSRHWRELLVGVPTGLVTMLATGWIAAGFGAAAVILLAPTLLRPSATLKAHITRLQALSSWTRRLSDLLGSGASQTLQDAITKAAAATPPPIAKETQALVSRMGPQGVEPALRQFAAEISDPVGDHVAMALIVRNRHGGVGLADVLAQLAGDVDEQVRMRRDILAEQSKQISNLRGILAVTVGAWVLLSIFARTYMTPYSEPAGQLALGLIVAGFGLTLAWFARLARPVLGARFLEDLPAGTHPADGPVALPAAGRPR